MKFKVGQRVRKTMGVRREGVVVRPFYWKDSTDGTYRAPHRASDAVWVRWTDGTKGWSSPSHLEIISSSRDVSHRSHRARRDEVPSPRRHKWVEDGMLLGFLEAIWLDSYMSWAEEHGHGYTTGHIPQHVRGLSDIPQAPPLAAKKLAKKYASLLVKMNKATLSQIFMRAAAAEEKRGRARIDVDPVKLGFYLAMQSRGHGVSWTDDHATFKVKLPSAEWHAYGKKGRVQVDGYVSERFAGGLT